jgi:hypothetical protein
MTQSIKSYSAPRKLDAVRELLGFACLLPHNGEVERNPLFLSSSKERPMKAKHEHLRFLELKGN